MNFSILSKRRAEIMGVAIIGILCCHLREACEIHQKSVPIIVSLLSRGICGVDIFLLLSGAGLVYSYIGNSDLKTFYKKRLSRLLPVYFLIAVPFGLIYDIGIQHGSFQTFLKNLFFISFFTNGYCNFWFIPAILFFYLLFPIIYKLLDGQWTVKIKSTGIKTCFLLAGIIVIDLLLQRYLPVYKNIAVMLGRVPAFVIGCYLGIKCYRQEKMTLAALMFVPVLKILTSLFYRVPALSGFLSQFNVHYLDTLLALLVLEIIVTGFCFIRVEKSFGILSQIGGITLEAYLLHMSFLLLFNHPCDYFRYFLLCFVFPLLFGWIIHKALHSVMDDRTRQKGMRQR